MVGSVEVWRGVVSWLVAGPGIAPGSPAYEAGVLLVHLPAAAGAAPAVDQLRVTELVMSSWNAEPSQRRYS